MYLIICDTFSGKKNVLLCVTFSSEGENENSISYEVSIDGHKAMVQLYCTHNHGWYSA